MGTKDKALAKRVRACAIEGSWRRGTNVIKNADTKPISAPKYWMHMLAELPEKDNIQEGMNSDPIILDIEEKAALREAIQTRINNGDVTVSQGCLGSGPGHWKPLLNGE